MLVITQLYPGTPAGLSLLPPGLGLLIAAGRSCGLGGTWRSWILLAWGATPPSRCSAPRTIDQAALFITFIAARSPATLPSPALWRDRKVCAGVHEPVGVHVECSECGFGTGWEDTSFHHGPCEKQTLKSIFIHVRHTVITHQEVSGRHHLI